MHIDMHTDMHTDMPMGTRACTDTLYRHAPAPPPTHTQGPWLTALHTWLTAKLECGPATFSMHAAGTLTKVSHAPTSRVTCIPRKPCAFVLISTESCKGAYVFYGLGV